MLKLIDKNQNYETIKVMCSSKSIFIHITTQTYTKYILRFENGLVFETLIPIP